MKVIIIEDEKSNSKRLIGLLKKMDDEFEILSTLESVEESVDWFANNEKPELIFMDVQLSDGICFEIFDAIEIKSPIIFTTAYDEYAIKAFKVNSIDYLLKPIDPVELEKSIKKFQELSKNNNEDGSDQIINLIKNLDLKKEYKSRMLLKSGKNFNSLLVGEIAYVFVENQLTYLYSVDKNRFILDKYLDDVEKELDPAKFYRINRQMLININSIQKITTYQGSRLKLILEPTPSVEVIVSREKVSAFKEWLND